MVQNVLYITKTSTYKELREILQAAPRLKSFPVVTDHSKLSIHYFCLNNNSIVKTRIDTKMISVLG